MMEQDRETQNYLLLQQGLKLPPRGRVTDTGQAKEKRKAKKVAKQREKASRSVLGAHNMFVNPEEKFIYNEHFRLFKNMIIERKGELSFADEVLLTDLCVARLRQLRKTRLESHFNRFMDRQCPQDPIGQTTSILKALGLTTEKDKSGANTKELMMKLLSKESLESEDNKKVNFEEWAELQGSTEVELKRYTPGEMPVYTNDIIDVSFDSNDEVV